MYVCLAGRVLGDLSVEDDGVEFGASRVSPVEARMSGFFPSHVLGANSPWLCTESENLHLALNGFLPPLHISCSPHLCRQTIHLINHNFPQHGC